MAGPRLVANERCVEATVCFLFFFFRVRKSELADFGSQHGRLHLEVEDAQCLAGRNPK